MEGGVSSESLSSLEDSKAAAPSVVIFPQLASNSRNFREGEKLEKV